MIAENTVESKVGPIGLTGRGLLICILLQVIDIQERKKKLVEQVSAAYRRRSTLYSSVTQAFSGIKTKETQRQKKEARLQGESRIFPFCRCMLRFVKELVALFGSRQEGA
ncbi:uncharacterized protein LAESUDRAFT_732253 [Laetiporus sulphureus 93-53]|uniref:Uncharacterized protein n=1 Tax=Laetiporus sulphureus 93-53 TaxID=1314785 RepID=A0A165B844_9APHY|nr:uncharacterized protein LAESUDRAFT_732253 [Laetiporus sulphureus 93-53]KZT00464.1 hypothetical protein LAESUDRAFT_732253 [Laetiporus sulphureus 93-53]